MNEQREKFVDEVLDKALVGYSQAEPRVGLEARVLARLEEEKTAPARAWWWKWAWAPAAAALLIAGAIYLARTRTQEPPVAVRSNPPVTTTAKTQAPPVIATTQRPEPPIRRSARPRVAAVAAKPSQFPSPQAPSEQDRLLLALVRQHPQEAAQQAQAAAQPLSEMKIEPLDIPPINPDGQDQQAPQHQ